MSHNKNVSLRHLEYSHRSEHLIEEVKETLKRESIAMVRDFPNDSSTLINFLMNLGSPLLKNSSTGQTIQDYIGEVKYRPDINEKLRLPTQGTSEILFHTARAFAKVRPTYFAMFMIDPGWVAPQGFDGESRLVRWVDVIKEYRALYPQSAEEDLVFLSTTPVSYKPIYAKDEPANQPIVLQYRDEDNIEIRVWEDAINTLRDIDIPLKNSFLSVFERFYEVTNNCSKAIAYIMEKNSLVIIDNRKVAHGRGAFLGQRKNVNGEIEYNTRKIFSSHIL